MTLLRRVTSLWLLSEIGERQDWKQSVKIGNSGERLVDWIRKMAGGWRKPDGCRMSFEGRIKDLKSRFLAGAPGWVVMTFTR